MSIYKWGPITDLPENWQALITEDLASLAAIWQERRRHVEGLKALNKFIVQLQRQWAIETGIIEGLYMLDRGVTQTLIEQGIKGSLIPHDKTNKPVSTIVPIIKDQESVIEGLFDFVKSSRRLSTSYIKELHQAFTAHQDTTEGLDQFGRLIEVPLKQGAWKTFPNNPTRPDGSIHEYCPPEHVASEMDRLIAMYEVHQANAVSPEVEAAWLHHRFTQIHPFQDGNGRVARALATLIFLRAGWFPLVVVSDLHRNNYINACEEADTGNLQSLVNLFTLIQKQAFNQALSISDDIIEEDKSTNSVIAAAVEKMKERKAKVPYDKQQVLDLSKTLEDYTEVALNRICAEIQVQVKEIDVDIFAEVNQSQEPTQNRFFAKSIEIAKIFHYFADLRSYYHWKRLAIWESGQRQTDIVVSFHSLGAEFSGVMAATAFVIHCWVEKGQETSFEGPYPVCDDMFQFAYNQDAQKVKERFALWLNDALVNGLDLWRRHL
ncbi:MAG: Fic family protein [Candidatus Hydrogenedentales bacterium]|jgi:Fic family protein